MSRRINYSEIGKPKTENVVQTCRTCAYAHDFHEISFASKEPFLCRCKYEETSQFLDKENKCRNYKKGGEDVRR